MKERRILNKWSKKRWSRSKWNKKKSRQMMKLLLE